MKEASGQTQFKNDIPLQPLQKGTSIVLRNIQFETGKYDLLTSSFIEIEKIVRVLSDNPQLRVRIIGHTDSIGKEKDNLSLSLQRAKVVVAYLVSRGVQPDRLKAEGLGDQQPIGDNSTEQGRALNRRTELVIISNE